MGPAVAVACASLTLTVAMDGGCGGSSLLQSSGGPHSAGSGLPLGCEARGNGGAPGGELTWVTAEKNACSSVGTAWAHWATRAQPAMGCSSWWSGANLRTQCGRECRPLPDLVTAGQGQAPGPRRHCSLSHS